MKRTTNQLDPSVITANPFLHKTGKVVERHPVIYDRNFRLWKINEVVTDASPYVFFITVLAFIFSAFLAYFDLGPGKPILIALVLLAGLAFIAPSLSKDIAEAKLKKAREDILNALGHEGLMSLAVEVKQYVESEEIKQIARVLGMDAVTSLKEDLAAHAIKLISEDRERQESAIDYLFGFEEKSLSRELEGIEIRLDAAALRKRDKAREEELNMRLAKSCGA